MLEILTGQKDYYKAGIDALEAIKYSPSDAVFIKPNIGTGLKIANTDPEFVRGLIRYIKMTSPKSQITVAEGSVQTTCDTTPDNFERQGWNKMCREEGVHLVNLNVTEDPFALLAGKDYINVAKMKTHMQTTVSLCCKNQKGLLSPEERKEFHRSGLHKQISELAHKVQPKISIVEGITGIEGNGPGEFGTPREDGIVLVGTDMFEVDCTACWIMGIDPMTVDHLKNNMVTSRSKLPDIRPFKRPDEKFKALNLNIYIGSACSSCISSVGEMCRLIRSSKDPRVLLWFARHGVLSETDIMLGKLADLPSAHGDVVFYGQCSGNLCSLYPDYKHILGCPPDPKNALKRIMEKEAKQPRSA